VIEMSYFSKKLILAVCALAGAAHAHDAFFESLSTGGDGKFIVRFADQGKPLSYAPSKLKRTWAYNHAGQELSLQQTPGADVVEIKAPADAVMLALEFENGFFSRLPSGSVEKPMNEVPGALSAVWAKKTGKYVLQWAGPVNKPAGMELEIIPTTASAPKAGDVIKVQVLWQGKPIEGVMVSKGEHQVGMTTDANGFTTYKVQQGQNFVWAERRIPVTGDARYTTLAVATNLVFVASELP
jgi:nickel transport protein